ncbi:hypothetical protein Krac_7326 [Ktedonobacter racemifer DSM 44963]|uniref:Transmembrane protein n=1 Tax=Ktedonobacter racemifer DSM 44963 TaxID=485913 RepID=D6TRY6_KTERA|nr:hypothetical protein Krac_7326 [Ktedonobacter racemifer DSM 44963]
MTGSGTFPPFREMTTSHTIAVPLVSLPKRFFNIFFASSSLFQRRKSMLDLLVVAVVIGAFSILISFVKACDRL